MCVKAEHLTLYELVSCLWKLKSLDDEIEPFTIILVFPAMTHIEVELP